MGLRFTSPLSVVVVGAVVAMALAPAAAWAQRGVPGGVPARDATRTPAAPALTRPETAIRGPDLLPVALAQGRLLEAARLLRRHRDVVDADPTGAPVVRSEVVAIDPDPAALERARGAGFAVSGERVLDGLGLRVVVLRARRGMGTHRALKALRRLDPQGEYDFNHLYLGSGSRPAAVSIAVSIADSPADSPADAGPGAATTEEGRLRVGLIDSGVAADHPALAGTDVRAWGCGGRPVPAAHGTAVASLLAGGPAGARHVLFAADIYCGQPTGGAVTGYVEAMAWLARERVGVINLSLVGPPNALLERATRALVERGHVLVAAVGNDGPTAAPLYPAAYPDVIGVTAVNAQARALPEALRGRQVDFAAPGSGLQAARPDGSWGSVRGTSFAAPLVARAAAALAPAPGRGRVEEVLASLAGRAEDLGASGRDDTYGHGLLAPPPSVAHAARP